jgi:DNA (cytosine-5)-methyltransferase 1
MSAWYNDIDLFCVGVLRRHIAAGNLPAGEVVNDDIRTVDPAALRGFRQWHLFAGIGGLPYGLRLGGWDDGEEILTAGFPCQPVSMAGKGLAQDDPRWLWPEVERFVRVLRPRVVLLENVPGLLVRGMGDVLGGLAACGYDAGWRVLAAADVGAPHLRQRVWIVAYPQGIRGQVWRRPRESSGGLAGRRAPMADAIGSGATGGGGPHGDGAPTDDGGERRSTEPRLGGAPDGLPTRMDGNTVMPWDDGWEDGVPRVANGVPHRVDRLRALGNAVVPQCVAALVPWIREVST